MIHNLIYLLIREDMSFLYKSDTSQSLVPHTASGSLSLPIANWTSKTMSGFL